MKLFIKVLSLTLLAGFVSCSSDDDNEPDIFVEEQGKVMFPGGNWVEAKTDFTEEELKEALISHPWDWSNSNRHMYYDNKHFSTAGSFQKQDHVLDAMVIEKWYFFDNGIVVLGGGNEVPNIDAYDLYNNVKYKVEGDSLWIDELICDANGNMNWQPYKRYRVVGFNSKSIFVDAIADPAIIAWDHLLTFKPGVATIREVWGYNPAFGI